MSPIIIIGDIHGCFKTFKALLKQLPKNITVYLVGDFIDRGPKSKQMVDFLIKHPKIKSVMGNHEQMMIQALCNFPGAFQDWMNNGAQDTLNSYGLDRYNMIDIPREHHIFLNNLPKYIELEDVIISHSADIRDVWSRGGLYPQDTKKFHIFGHTPVKNAIIKRKYANIDTGCTYKDLGFGKLTALEYPSMKIWSQKKID